MTTGGMEALIELGQQVDEMTFEPLTSLCKLEVDDTGAVDVNESDLTEEAANDPALAEKAADEITGGDGYYAKVNGEWTKLGTAESVIRQGVQSFIIEQLTGFGSKVAETMKGINAKIARALGA
jgi:hypothetical protein